MTRLRRLTRSQWAVVLAVMVLVAGGITVAALSLGGPSRPAVKLQVTNPSPAPSGPTAPATSGLATATATTPAAGQPAPQGPATPTVITPPPRAYTVSPPTPTTPAKVASPSPPGAVEVAKCPLNMKCTLP